MKTIYKYEIKAGLNIIDMPYSAEILTVQTQEKNSYIWALVDTEHPNEARSFFTFGTGWDMEKELANHNKVIKPYKYIGTFQLPDFGLVFHLYEVR
jgi:hypothetical protein